MTYGAPHCSSYGAIVYQGQAGSLPSAARNPLPASCHFASFCTGLFFQGFGFRGKLGASLVRVA